MTASEITCFSPINSTDAARVAEIAESIASDGWHGAPVLVHEGLGRLITGSHRLAALRMLDCTADEIDVDDLGDVAEPVDDIVDAWCEANDATIDDIPYDALSAVFAGTWVEQYAETMTEW